MKRWMVLALVLLWGCAPSSQAEDPFAGAGVWQATAEAAEATASYYGAQITATAEAQRVEATQMAATATQAVWEVTATAESARATGEAAALATSSARTQSALDVDQTATVSALWAVSTQQAIIAESNRLALERERQMNDVRAVMPWAAGGAFFLLLMWLAVLLARASAKRPQVIQRDERGDAPLVVMDKMIYDADRNPRPAMIGGKKPEIPELVAGDEQRVVTQRDQTIDLMTRGMAGQARRQMRAPMMQTAEEIKPAISLLSDQADWGHMQRWPGGAFVLGEGEKGGPVYINPENEAHFLFAGTTGSGKTKGGLRPLIAQALASGWQAVIIDRSGLDFDVFDGHPGAKLVTLKDKPGDAIGYLQSAYAEIQRRFGMLREGKRGFTPVLMVLDEFSDLADSLENGEREKLWRAARMVAAEGRKARMHLALALQDPSYRAMDLRIRRNMTPICYRVRDEAASRLVLGDGGAQGLRPGQFLTSGLKGVRIGAAFNPSDDDLVRFLESRKGLGAGAVEITPKVETGKEDERGRVIELLKAGRGMNEVCREVYGYTGGQAYEAVRRIRDQVLVSKEE